MNLHRFSIKTRKSILPFVIFLESLAIALSVWGAITAGYSPKAFFEEGGYMTILSCFQLLGSAILARRIFLLAKNSATPILVKSSLFWKIMSWSLFFLVVDEALQIHERIDLLLHILLNIWFGFQETYLSDLADDLIVGGYVVFFLVYVATRWRSLQLFRRSFIYFKIGLVLTSVMIVGDVASNNELFISMLTDDSHLQFMWQVWVGLIEDIIKIYAEGIFLVGIYRCWRIAKSIDN